MLAPICHRPCAVAAQSGPVDQHLTLPQVALPAVCCCWLQLLFGSKGCMVSQGSRHNRGGVCCDLQQRSVYGRPYQPGMLQSPQRRLLLGTWQLLAGACVPAQCFTRGAASTPKGSHPVQQQSNNPSWLVLLLLPLLAPGPHQPHAGTYRVARLTAISGKVLALSDLQQSTCPVGSWHLRPGVIMCPSMLVYRSFKVGRLQLSVLRSPVQPLLLHRCCISRCRITCAVQGQLSTGHCCCCCCMTECGCRDH